MVSIGAHHPPTPVRTLRERVAKAIFEAKYPDALFEKLHPRRVVREQRLKEADAVLALLEKLGKLRGTNGKDRNRNQTDDRSQAPS